MKKLGVGIIGCGNISAAYLRLGPMFKGLDFRAVADINMDAAIARASDFDVRAESVEGLLAASDIDIVVNLTIPAVHYQVSKSVLEAGKHVYSEKPFVLSLEEGEDLRRLATARGLRVGSAPDTFLGGAHQLARAKIDDGLIGDVVGGTATVMSHGMEHWHPNPDFFFLPGAGPVLDVGPYYITNLVQLIGPVKRVAALTSSASPTRTITTEGPRQGEKIPVKTPTNVQSLLEFHSGATVSFIASWDIWAHRHEPMQLFGAEGTLFVPDPNFFGGNLEVGGKDGAISEVAGWDHAFGVINEGEGEGAQANYRGAGLADLAQAISAGRAHRCSLDLAVHAVDVMTSILTAGESGGWVDIASTCDRPAPLSPDEAAALLA